MPFLLPGPLSICPPPPPIQDRLYVEYTVRFDPKHWELQTAWEQWEPGMLKVRARLGRTRV